MSLERFIGSRLVVLSPSTALYDAGRAMLDNRIGTVLVHDGRSLVGIVTDRDLGLDVVIDDLDVYAFELADIMSMPVTTVDVRAALTDVTAAMIERRVRRIPILDGDAIVGIVTFDDLVLDGAATPGTLAAILRAQLEQPSRLKPSGTLRPARAGTSGEPEQRAARRHDMHRRQAYARLLRHTLELTDLRFAHTAADVLRVVLDRVARRLPPAHAAHLLAQLPSMLRDELASALPSKPDLSICRASIERDLQQALSVGPDRARQLLDQVGKALGGSLSPGELAALDHHLPANLRGLLAA